MKMEKVVQIIERLRGRLNRISSGKKLTDAEVVMLSTKLDKYLNLHTKLKQSK